MRRALASELFDGAPPDVLDMECLATGIVDGVGLDAFEKAGVRPEDLADADSLEGIGVEITPAVRTAVTAAFDDCFDGAVFAEQTLASLDFGFPAEVMSCVAGSMDELMSTLVANRFLDATGDFGPDNFGDAAQLGATCAAELAADAPGSAVAWAEGSEAFGAALVMRMTTPVYEGAAASRVDEATCFVGAMLELLGPALSAMPTITVGDLILYQSAATTPDAIGLAIDEPLALALAEANVACIDNNSITAQATALTMTALLGVHEGMALRLETCFDETIDDEIWIESIRLNYLHGSDVYDLPEAVPLFETMAQAGEICGARALAPPSGGG